MPPCSGQLALFRRHDVGWCAMVTPACNQIERLFNKPKNWQRVAIRYDKTKESYLGFVAIAAVKLWIPFVHERESVP